LLTAVISSAGRTDTDAIVGAFRSRCPVGCNLELTVVASSEEATQAARDAAGRSRIVAAVGGDGTVADVATGIFRTDAVLGIVSNGSTNITGRSLGIPDDPYQAIALLIGPHVQRRIDVGRSGDRSFLHIAGAGIDAEVFSRTRPDWKRRVGWLAYVPPAVAALRFAPSTVRVTVDDDQVEARSPLVLIANGGSVIAPQFRVYPGIAPDDGWLDLLLFTPRTATEMASLLTRAGGMSLHRSPHVKRWQAKCIRIEALPPLSVQLDGDPRGMTPREFSVAPQGIAVVIPGSTRGS
jgi:YegS/Rv2252/BmrU family lipid kinase